LTAWKIARLLGDRGYVVTGHAAERIATRGVPVDAVVEVLEDPDVRVSMTMDTGKSGWRCWGTPPSAGGRKVFVGTRSDGPIVTAGWRE